MLKREKWLQRLQRVLTNRLHGQRENQKKPLEHERKETRHKSTSGDETGKKRDRYSLPRFVLNVGKRRCPACRLCRLVGSHLLTGVLDPLSQLAIFFDVILPLIELRAVSERWPSSSRSGSIESPSATVYGYRGMRVQLGGALVVYA